LEISTTQAYLTLNIVDKTRNRTNCLDEKIAGTPNIDQRGDWSRRDREPASYL
jgi:hypothetical protein